MVQAGGGVIYLFLKISVAILENFFHRTLQVKLSCSIKQSKGLAVLQTGTHAAL